MTMEIDPPPIVVGLGCSSAATTREIVALIKATLIEAGLRSDRIAAFATHVRKRDSLALMQVAAIFDVPLRFLDDDDLAPGVPGTCEAVAAAAGPLIVGKRKSSFATCALSIAASGFDISVFGQPANPNASMASPTLLTSFAGP